MSEDWLDTAPEGTLPAVVELPVSYGDRITLAASCWERLTLGQRTYLTALRGNKFRVRRTNEQLSLHECDSRHARWKAQPDYGTVFRIWLAIEADGALDKDALLVRQDAIVEQLMEPKPILYQGSPTGYEENQAPAAARANETLMKAAGLLKDKEVEVNVGVAINNGPPTLEINVMPMPPGKNVGPKGVVVDLPVIDAEFVGPEDDWLSTL